MKKFVGITIAALMVVGIALAKDANQMHYVALLGASVASEAGTATDVSDYKGNGTVVASWGKSVTAAYTGTVTIATSATSGGTYVTVTNLANTAGVFTSVGATTNQLDEFQIDLARLSKYVKVTAAHVGATNPVSVVLVAPIKAD